MFCSKCCSCRVYCISNLPDRMGKTKKVRKSAVGRDDPVGLDSAILQSGVDIGELLVDGVRSGGSNILANITAQLQSANPEDRVCGCHSIASLAGRQEVREQLLDHKVRQ